MQPYSAATVKGVIQANRGVNMLAKNDPSRVLYFLMTSKPLPGARSEAKLSLSYKASLDYRAEDAADLAKREPQFSNKVSNTRPLNLRCLRLLHGSALAAGGAYPH